VAEFSLNAIQKTKAIKVDKKVNNEQTQSKLKSLRVSHKTVVKVSVFQFPWQKAANIPHYQSNPHHTFFYKSNF
jgi:hypothetical protein